MHAPNASTPPVQQSRIESENEQALVAAAKSGDREAFRHLYNDNIEVVLQYLKRRLPFHEAEDAAADVFCSAWTSIPNYEWRGVPFRAWLLVIARNHIRSRARRHAVLSFCSLEPQHLHQDAICGADVDAISRIDSDALATALEQVADRFRAVLVKRFIEELSVHETAIQLGCSDENVRVRTFRGLQQLRALIRRDVF